MPDMIRLRVMGEKMICKFIIKGIRQFNEKRVIDKTLMLLGNASQNFIKWYNPLVNDERESYTLMLECLSTQGVGVKRMIGGSIIVELPWLASGNDTRLCYAFLNAVKWSTGHQEFSMIKRKMPN